MPVQRIHLVVDPEVGPALWAREQGEDGRTRAATDLTAAAERLGITTPGGPLRHRVAVRTGSGPRAQTARVPAMALSDVQLLAVLAAVRDAAIAHADTEPDLTSDAPASGAAAPDAAASLGALLSARQPLRLEENLLAMPDLLAGALRDVQAERIVARREVRIMLDERFGQVWAHWLPLVEEPTTLLRTLVDARCRLAFAAHRAKLASSPDIEAVGTTESDTDGNAGADTRATPPDPHALLPALESADAALRVDLPGMRRIQTVLDEYIDSGRPRAALRSRDGAELVVRLFEPEQGGPHALWPLQTCLRETDGTVHPVADLRALGDLTAAGAVEAAGHVLRLAPALRDAHTAKSGVDWNLTTIETSRFLADDAAALEAGGVTVLLPRTWTKQAATVRIDAEPATEGGEKKATSGVGLQAMASFRWSLAVGETELTEEEMEEIRAAQSELVQLRGQWIRLDQTTMRAAERFLERFTTGKRPAPRFVSSAQRDAGRDGALPPPAPRDGASGGMDGASGAAATVPGASDAGAPGAASAAATWTAFFASVISPEADGLRIDLAALREEAAPDGASARNSMLRLLPGGAGPVAGTSPSTLQATLRPYQQQGLDWMWALHEIGMGGILADDMGLGKTMQVLALLCREREVLEAPGRAADAPTGRGPEAPVDQAPVGPDPSAPLPGPTLLVCPMSVVGAWQREAERWAPHLRVHVHHGGERVRDASFTEGAHDLDLVITTYSLLDRDQHILRTVPWHRVVFDEAQHIKNPGTAVTRAARALPAQHRLALTGTPVENRLRDLHSLMEAVNPGLLGSVDGFSEHIATPIEQEGDEAALSRLKVVTAPFILRRLKTDRAIITDLPEKTEMTRTVNLTPEQAGLYEALVTELMTQIDGAEEAQRRSLVGAALTRLKQVCNHPAHYLGDGSAILDEQGEHRSGKLELVDDILSTAFARGEKVLLFTQFTTFGHMLVPYWRDAFGVDVPFLHGGVTKRDRDAMVAQFQSTPDAPGAMLLSLRAGGTGLTLTAANHVVHLDRWWNPAVENQATDRAFRIGQTKNVQVRKLVSAGTVEERIDTVLADKSSLAELAVTVARGQGGGVGSGESWLASLDDAALHELLRLDAGEVQG